MKLDFDPEIDPPATVAIIGGGPVGIEAALYGRVLGYSMLVLDTAKVGSSLVPWNGWPMPGNWNQVASPLGMAALQAQGKELPTGENTPSYRDYVEKYLWPLARTDLLYESIQINANVESISRLGCPPDSVIPKMQRAELEFRVLINSQQRGQYSQLADIILDCSGWSEREGLAPGGGLAIGESNIAKDLSTVRTGKRDILGSERGAFMKKFCLLWGNNVEACANALELSQLVDADEQTKVTWILPKQLGKDQPRYALDSSFQELHEQLVALASRQHPRFGVMEAWGIEAVNVQTAGAGKSDECSLRLQTTAEETLEMAGDVFINCANRRPNWTFADCLPPNLLPVSNPEPAELISSLTAEPHYYVLGGKSEPTLRPASAASHNSASNPYASAFRQIRETFALIGGRAELNLYESVKPKTGTP